MSTGKIIYIAPSIYQIIDYVIPFCLSFAQSTMTGVRFEKRRCANA